MPRTRRVTTGNSSAGSESMHQVATGSGASHPFIIPLTKIDVERRLVIGTAAEEIADKSREIMDYATARPQFEEWSDSFSAATGGLSKGNLRVMHTKTVAGRLDAIEYDDASKKVQIVAKVSDDNEWKKCLDGAYTGFSIGGGYLKKWKDPESGLTRYTPIVREISLVDNPCMPTATFAELVKADGIVEMLPLHGVVRGFAQAWSERPVSFGQAWQARPRTFAEQFEERQSLAKYDSRKPKRSKGEAVSLAADWSEAKHPRSGDGEFSGSGGSAKLETAIPTKAHLFARAKLSPADQALEPAKQQQWDDENARPNRENTVAAMSEGAAGAMFAQKAVPKGIKAAVRAARFGFGEAADRNLTANKLRGDRRMRSRLVSDAHEDHLSVLKDGPQPEDLGASARRKVMEEAITRGSSLDEAKLHGDKFAAILNRKKGKNLVPDVFVGGIATRRVPGKAAAAAQRATQQSLRGGVLRAKHDFTNPVHQTSRQVMRGGFGRSLISLPIGMAGAALAAQSAYRNQREATGHEVTDAHHKGANVGDALRATSGAALGQIAGGALAIPYSLYRQGVRATKDIPRLVSSLSAVKPELTMRHMGRGALLGAGAGIATGLPAIYREWSARHSGAEKS